MDEELAPVEDRLRWLRVNRALLLVATAALGLTGGAPAALWWATGLLAAAAAADLVVPPARTSAAVAGRSGLLLTGDTLVLALLVVLDGSGALAPLVVLHVVAVALLGSWRTGLKVALGQSLAFAVADEAASLGLLRHDGTLLPGWVADRPVVALASASWLGVLTTSVASSLNERELRRRRLDLQVVHEFVLEVARAGDAESTARLLCRAVVERVAVRGVVVVERVGATSVVSTSRESRHVDVDEAAEAWLRALGADDHPRLVVGAREPVVRVWLHGAEHVSVHPLRTTDPASSGSAGVLLVDHGAQRPSVDARTLELLRNLADHASSAVEQARLRERLQAVAVSDALTGVANRRAFDAALAAAAAEPGAPVALLLVDLDHFKTINDTHGHGVGDDVLVAAAAALSGAVGGEHLVARVGGEEFAVLVTGADARHLPPVVDAVLDAVRGADGPVPVTASVGAATAAGTWSADGLLREADEALYRAKESGRDRGELRPAGTGPRGRLQARAVPPPHVPRPRPEDLRGEDAVVGPRAEGGLS